MTNPTEKVPIPPARLWREFKIRLVPVIVFVLASILVGILWKIHVVPSHMTGVVMAELYQVRSPRDGLITDFNKTRFDMVQQGETLLHIVPTEANRLRAELDVIRAETDLMRAGLEPLIGRQRNVINYEELRLDMMNARIQLAADRLLQQQFERDAQRQATLHQQGLISDSEYDDTVTRLDMLKVTIAENETLLDNLATRLDAIDAAWPDVSLADSMDAAIRVKETELAVVEADLQPLAAPSPIEGMIAEVFFKNGEFTLRGDMVLVVRSAQVDYIIAYMRQPLARIPEIGRPVRVLSNARRAAYPGTITEIGTQLEPMHEATLRPGQLPEQALPIRITVEPGHALIPGEVVRIRL